jgi:hypothetical protein
MFSRVVACRLSRSSSLVVIIWSSLDVDLDPTDASRLTAREAWSLTGASIATSTSAGSRPVPASWFAP